MKRIYLYAFLLGLLSFVSCKDDDTNPVLDLKVASELKGLSASEFIFNKANLDAAFPTINWSAANYGLSAVVNYAVTLTNDDTETSILLGETGETKLELTNAEMNIFMAKVKAYPGQTYHFTLSLTSKAYDCPVDEASNSIKITGTPFDPKAVGWDFVYVAVGYPDWDWTEAYMLGDPDQDGTYNGYVNFAKDVTYAIIDGKDLTSVRASGQQIAQEGFYEITLNSDNKVAQSAEPLVWSVIGDATAGGWEKDTEMEYDPATRLWTKVTRMIAGKEFKFRGNSNWDINMGAVSDEESKMGGSLLFNSPNNIKVEALKDTAYIVTLNLTEAGKYSYSMEVTNLEISSEALYLPGSYQAGGGWKPEAADCYKIVSASRDYVYSGIYYIPTNTEFKFTDGPNWGSEFGLAKGTTILWTANNTQADFSLVTSEGNNIKIEYGNYYRISVNTKKLTCSMVKAGWGIVGDATPGGWDKDFLMDYDPATKLWTANNIVLGTGNIKFRWNGAWTENFGGSFDALTQGGADIPVTPGTYTIVLDPVAKKAVVTSN